MALVGVPHFEMDFDGDTSHSGTKRSWAEMQSEERQQLRLRHRLWLKKGSPGTAFGAWRPKELHRREAKSWLICIGSQLRSCTSLPGLSCFSRQEDMESWRSPFSWPFSAISMDLGSDGNAGYRATERMWQLNV